MFAKLEIDPSGLSARRPWLGASLLLMAAAVAAFASLVLHWRPCRGSMLDGSVVVGFAVTNFSDACLRRMDGGLPFPYPPELAEQEPWATELGAAAMGLAGVAGLVIVLGLRLPPLARMLLTLPGLHTLALSATSAIAAADPLRADDAFIPGWWWVAGELAALAGLCVLTRLALSRHGGTWWRLGVVLWAVTGFGLLHSVTEYLMMTGWSEADWDVPPGTGTLTVVTLAVGAAAALLQVFRPGRVTAPAAPSPALAAS